MEISHKASHAGDDGETSVEAAVSASFCTVVPMKAVLEVNYALCELDHCAAVNESI